jgi:hypothetical protein
VQALTESAKIIINNHLVIIRIFRPIKNQLTTTKKLSVGKFANNEHYASGEKIATHCVKQTGE